MWKLFFLKNCNSTKKKKRTKLVRFFLFCDLARIQTWNLLSRNQMRYSVAPRGLYIAALLFCKAGANILFILKSEKIKRIFCSKLFLRLILHPVI